MNIIQIQDRLKGLPEDALVNYVKNPMGEVPIYLALGEMQRRKDMKARFDASKPEEPSIAEQLVAEAEPMQMGLGAMAPQQMMPEGQGVGAPQPAPEMDPRQMAASGIAANPQSAVGGTAMMKEGGIVGYAYGGSVSPKYNTSVEQVGQYVVTNKDGSKTIVEPGDPGYLTATKELSDEEKAKGYKMSEFGDVKYVAPYGLVKSSPIAQYQNPTAGTYQSFDESRRMDQVMNPKKYRDLKDANEAAKIEIAELDYLKDTGKDISIEKDKKGKGKTEDDSDFNIESELDKILANENNNTNTRTRDTDYFDAFAGITTMPIQGRGVEAFKKEYNKIKEEFGISNEFYDEGKADAINMALIQAGLGIAGGTSANPLENIAKGSLPAIGEFNKEQARLSGAKRLENLAGMNAYIDEQKEIRGYQSDYLKNFLSLAASQAQKGGANSAAAHKLATDFIFKALPGGLSGHYGMNYRQFPQDYGNIFNSFLNSLNNNTPMDNATMSDILIRGGTFPKQEGNTSSKLKLVE